MKVLVACEFSGVVRDAFRRLGHDAWSCDIVGPEALPGEFAKQEFPNYHLEGDVRDFLNHWRWDMMIAFPPCTHLAVSGARYFKEKRADGRQQAALDFVYALFNAPIKRIAIENPVGIISTEIRKPEQIIQPWQFGHPESKATCLWLKNLPKLRPTNTLPLPASGRWENQTASGQNKLGPSPRRAMERSRTYRGIANAMAAQWGGTR